MSNHLPQKRASMQTFIITLVVVGCLAIAPARADLGDELFKFTASDAAADDQFGWAVGVSGNTAIVGAEGDDDAGNRSGSAYLFDVTTGQELRKLTASDAAADATFGRSVAISGNVAIVGAQRHNNTAGAAYLFDVTTGEELFKLTASDAAFDRHFGSSVGISGNTAIVGAFGDNHAGVGSGSAYLFDVTTGQQLAKVTSSDASANDLFGLSVAISGNTALIGAPFEDDRGDKSGAAYLFDVTTGQQLAKLTNSDADTFGGSVAISGNRALVGGWRLDLSSFEPSSAYLFDVTTGQELFTLTASDAATGDNVDAVAISGNIALVGSPVHGGSFGAAYLFDVTTGLELTKLTASDAAANDEFGFAVAISGNTAIVGTSTAIVGTSTGAAYLFSTVPEPASLALLALGLPLLVCRNALRNTERRIP